MPYCKKIVILNSLEKNSDSKAVLSLEQNGIKLKCVLKTYNKEPLSDLVVGLKINNNLLSPINVIAKKSSSFEFELNNNLDVSSEVCALICLKNESEVKPILYGGSEPQEVLINAFNKEVVKYSNVGVVPSVREERVEMAETMPEQRELPLGEVAQTSLFETSDEEVEATIDEEMGKLLDEVDYKNIATTAKNVENVISEKIEKSNEKSDEAEPPIFYNLVEEQIEKMFETYPKDAELMELIPNSRFAKIDFDGEGLYYSLGLIYGDNGNVEKICYAVKGKKDAEPPEDIKEYCFYLPVGEEDGYFVLLQNAKTGENIVDDSVLI